MNTKYISLVVLVSVALAGCSSINATNQSETQIETTTQVSTSEVTFTEDVTITSETQLQDNVYPLDDMTAEEIVEECKKIWETIPKSHGITVEEYKDILGHQQAKHKEHSFPSFVFDDGSNDYILSVEVKGVRKLDNGTVCSIGEAEEIIWIWMTIDIHIEDQDKAEQVYNLMLKNVFRATTDDRNSDSWEATAENPQAPFVCATMCKDGTGYRLKFTNISI